MSVEIKFKSLVEEIKQEAYDLFRETLIKDILVGPYNDPEYGDGFSIFFNEERIGWWKTRKLACDAANKLSKVIRQYSVD